jgi:hypothetical protein
MTKKQLFIMAIFAFFIHSNVNAQLATYHIEGLNDGYYQVSLVPNVNWNGTDAITATAQVTIKVGASNNNYNKMFQIIDLTMLQPSVTWTQNSRYDAPAEDPGFDYISFGLDSKGTLDIPYVQGDTVPLFKFKNTGICSEDSVFLMAIEGDPFQWPNSLNANVGQQLSVSGYNDPDVPLAVSGKVPCMAEVVFCLKAGLQGNYSTYTGMHDSLRTKHLIPLTEPYKNYQPIQGQSFFPFTHVDDGGSEVINDTTILNVEGNDAIVDWVMVELRNQHDSSQVLSTRSALIQRDGDIVELDGVSSVIFRKLKSDYYFISVRHRNHLGLMTATKIQIIRTYYNTAAGRKYDPNSQICNNDFDFTDVNNEVYGENSGYLGLNIKAKSQPTPIPSVYTRLMWAGNSNADRYIMFQGGGVGEGLDIDNVFHNIITDSQNYNYSYNHVRNGYYPGDNNLDGYVKYQGPANDIDQFIFFNIISRHPGNVNKYVNYYITEQLPE